MRISDWSSDVCSSDLRLAMPGFMVALALLVLVLIPGVGHEVNGAHRWIPLGPLNFQPSELMKLAALLYAADYTVRKQEPMQARSEERRVGKAWVSTCKSRWSRTH